MFSNKEVLDYLKTNSKSKTVESVLIKIKECHQVPQSESAIAKEIDKLNVKVKVVMKTRMECSPEHVCHLLEPCQKIWIFDRKGAITMI